MRYLEVAEALREEIQTGRRRPGGLIDSEATLAGRYGVSRDTVRRALEHLRQDGLVASRQGFGWYVAADPVRQALGRLTTIEATLAEAGMQPSRRVLEFGPGVAPSELKGERVVRVRRLNLADDEPFGLVTVWVPSRLAQGITAEQAEARTFYELLGDRGVVLGRAQQTITATLANAEDAQLLAVPSGSPLLVCRRATHDADNQVVLVSEHRYPAHRTEFCVDVARADPATALAPPGVRLVHSGGSHD